MSRLLSLMLMCTSAPVWAAEAVQTLPEITVTGAKDTLAERREALTQKVIVSRKEIEDMGVITIGEVLGKLPGVEVTGGEGARRARGMSRDSVQILVDGERSAGGSRIATGIVGRLPVGDLERVEILRGASAEFGGSSSVTVNLVMKKALPKRSTTLKLGLGLRDSKPNAQFNWTENGGEGDFGWSLPVTLNLWRSPTQAETERQDSTAGTRTLWQKEREQGAFTFREFVVSPRLNWKNGSDRLAILPTFFDGLGKRNSDMTQMIANPATSNNLVANGSRSSREESHRRMLRLRADGEKNVDDAKLTARAAISQGKSTADVTRNALDALNVLTTSTDNSTSNETEWNTALRLDKPVGDHLFAVGLEHIRFRRTDNQNFAGNFNVVATYQSKEQQSIAWVQDDWTVQPKLTFTYGLRGELIALDSATVSRQHGRLMPSVAVRYEPAEKWLLRSSLGTGLKMPRLNEISDAISPSIATNTPVEADRRGNTNLLPERSLNFEAVVERYLDADAGLLSANLYVRATQDFTERRVQLEGLRWVDRPYNEGKSLHWGFELDGKIKTDSWGWEGATVKAHLTLPNADVNDTRLGITRMARDTPRYALSSGVDASLPKIKSSYGISLQLSGRSATEIPNEQRVVTQAKTTLDAFWLYKLTDQFNLRINAQNLLAPKTIRQTTFTSTGNTWQLNTTDVSPRTLQFTLEGRF